MRHFGRAAKAAAAALLALAALAVWACDADELVRAGEWMGAMADGAWGIEPDMAAVGAAADAVDGSVRRSEDGAMATRLVLGADGEMAPAADIDLEKAAEVRALVAEIGGSQPKLDRLAAEMAEPVGATPEEQALVRRALEDERDRAAAKAEAAAALLPAMGVPEEALALVDALVEGVKSLPVPEEPTKADVATAGMAAGLARSLEERFAAEGAEEVGPEDALDVLAEVMETIGAIKAVNGGDAGPFGAVDVAALVGMAQEAAGGEGGGI